MSLTKTLTQSRIPGLDNYVLEQELNHGYFGRVHQAKEVNSEKRWACKFIQKTLLSDRQKRNIFREIELMRMVDHPNIIKFKEAIETPDYYVIVMELMRGGDLFDRLQQQSTFTEEDARRLLIQVANAVKYLHGVGIAHRDLKIENLMFSEPDGNIIKVGDFGLAKRIGRLPTKTPVGTKEYMAPEIVKGEYYSTTVDIWSLGCLAFILLYGTFPFYNETDKRGNRLIDITDKIKTGFFTFPQEGEYENEPISAMAKDLIAKSLIVDPSQRIDIHQFLSHPWLMTVSTRRTPLNAPAAVRTAEGLVSMREFFNVGVHTERNRVDSDGDDDTMEQIAEQKQTFTLPSIVGSKLLEKRNFKKQKQTK